jgi:hypothetical protein
MRAIYDEVNNDRVAASERLGLPDYQPGDKVLIYDPTTKKGQPSKLKQRWQGPYTIIECITPVTFSINKDGINRTVNAERMKKWVGDSDPSTERERQLELLNAEIEALRSAQHSLVQRRMDREAQRAVLLEADVERSAAAAVTVSDTAVTSALNTDLCWVMVNTHPLNL